MSEPNRRHRQIASAIRDELVTIARKDISDPHLERVGMVTFSGVDLSDDLRDGTVWVAFMGKEEKAQDVQAALEALNRSSKFIHRLLIKRLPMKVHPRLRFRFDHGFDRAAEIGKALSEAAAVEKETQDYRAARESKNEDE
jgi:ribosome-binding factor A